MFELNQANARYRQLSEARVAIEAERDRLLAENTALRTERDQLLARAEGDRELLGQLGTDGVGTLKAMIDELTGERQTLEWSSSFCRSKKTSARWLTSKPHAPAPPSAGTRNPSPRPTPKSSCLSPRNYARR